MPSKTVAVIPAAGKGTRLGLDSPKIFTSITLTVSPWTILREALAPLVDHIEVVLPPPWTAYEGYKVGISIQPEPLGMGDAVFCADWHDADTIVVVWGDQIGLSADTVAQALGEHDGTPKTVIVPMVQVKNPYTDYVFEPDGHLHEVLQAREGDTPRLNGWADVGVFVLSTEGLRYAWDGYKIDHGFRGGGELNFLPFLVYLAHHGWDVDGIPVDDPDEARGLNTPEDLEWARARFAK